MKRSKKRKSRRYEEEEDSQIFGLNPETKRGIIIVIVFALAAIMFLSFFGIAGSVGEYIEMGLVKFFGWDRYLVPIILIIVGASKVFPDRGQLSIWNYFGFLFFFLSFNGLLNLLLIHVDDPVTLDISVAGGYLGEFLALILPAIIGFWGAFVVLAALLVASILLVFNTSLRHLFGAHQHVTGWFGSVLHLGRRRSESNDEEEDEEEEGNDYVEEDEEEYEEEDEDKAEASPGNRPVPSGSPVEVVLTSSRRRKLTIPFDLLDLRSSKGKSGNIDKNKKIIEDTFRQFGIEVEMADTAVGPTVTQYSLKPSSGIKLSRIVGLQNDLALALAAHPIRIEAPIPGKSLVGIEIPNHTAATVCLRELVDSKEFKKRTSDLSVPLGKDVSGLPWLLALEKMPHMLVAGATGSGKSVCLNTIIISLLYENGPDDLKLILVDPKRVEMKLFEGIPHLLVPPITKLEDTINALKWTVREMDRRLDVLSKFGVRDIHSYNSKTKEKMPKIVVIIDELADLMATSSREIEATIARIAQIARAVGIHLVLATQRPSVDVITGVIKANIPARIAFAVASQTDSRTILDSAGAEKLLGRGDMLFTYAELSKPKRIQGAFVSEAEVGRVVDFLKKEGVPDYNYQITETEKTGTILDAASDGDELLEDAIQVILESGKASTSFLQRRLKVGYARAARMMDLLEEMGVISAGEGAKPREILINEWPPGGSDDESSYVDSSEVGEEEEDDQDWEDDDGDLEEEEEEESDEDPSDGPEAGPGSAWEGDGDEDYEEDEENSGDDEDEDWEEDEDEEDEENSEEGEEDWEEDEEEEDK